jgi:hypothetical protein
MKINILKGLSIAVCALLAIETATAREVKGLPPQGRDGGGQLQRKSAGCLPATAQADIDINNVRARILNGGDMWWDLNSVARYEIPKVGELGAIRKNSMFAGAIWVGGLDVGGNLKVAAMTYRQSGSDYFPGPLDTTTGDIDVSRCKAYDRIWKVNRDEIEAFVKDPSLVTDNILSWPGNGDPSFGEPKFLAPFFDGNGDGIYNGTDGVDYPILDPTRLPEHNRPEDQPDQMLFFVYNDKGNIHSESKGIPIGIELQTTAFAFATNDEVNNMTFYKTKITNRAFDEIRNCYFGQWVDPDLGNYADDYVGVDVSRNLGFCYNGDDNDEGVLGYGLNPPSVGTTFFEGPKDSAGNEIGLTKFVYYNNNWDLVTGNPSTAEHYYGYLRGMWKNGSPLTYGGNGNQTGDATSYMFPGDPNNPAEWHEKSAGNTPGDRRYLQSAGPFSLKPGAVNYVTVGVVWARTTAGGATGSLNLLKLASDKAQKLYNNKFQIPDGPPAPTLAIQELDQEIIITMVDSLRTLKQIESFSTTTQGIQGPLHYRFQGYKIYQLRDATVTTADLENVERARLLFQADIRDSYGRIINQVQDPELGVNIPKIMVNGNNNGISHSISVKEDLFATANKALVNFKSYYYVILAYAVCVNDGMEPIQYLEGRLNVNTYRAIPHKPAPESGGTILHSKYADGPAIKRISGSGNGGVYLDLSERSIEEALRAPYVAKNPLYLGGKGPVNIKVIDPLKVPVADFEFTILDSSLAPGARRDSLFNASTYWYLVNKSTNDTVFSDTSLLAPFEQVIPKWGLSVDVRQAVIPGYPLNEQDGDNGFISGDIIWGDDSKQWLTGLPDDDNSVVWFNWIRSGTRGRADNFANSDYVDDYAVGGESMDPFEKYEKILSGIIAPYALAARAPYSTPMNVTYGLAFGPDGRGGQGSQIGFDNQLQDLNSVDIVITPDRNKWTRCVVVETGEDPALSFGNAPKHYPRRSPSLDRDLKTVIPGETGRSWFPGYAINVETGERLNIMFGEDSYLSAENGSDMIWNPTQNLLANNQVSIGGKHYLYIMGRKTFGGYTGPGYDQGDDYLVKFNSNNPQDVRRIYAQCMWVMPPMMVQGYSMKDGVPPSEVRIKLRVKRAYGSARVDLQDPASTYEQPKFEFNTADIAPEVSEQTGKNAMDLIRVVPNPYYAYSAYEGSQLDNRVKITNLPPKCTINIFTVNGTLIRQIKKDDESTYVDWELKNHVNVPIASGMYIVHVDAGDLGEKIIKWFGVMRQIDLDSF